jgi:hypothetical protein
VRTVSSGRRHRAARGATFGLALVLTAGACTSAEEAPAGDAGEPSRPAATGTSGPEARAPEAESDRERLAGMRPVPDARRPRALARRLTFLDSVVRDPAADPADLRRAAELEQLATRALVHVSQAQARAVLRLLRPGVRRRIGADVAAARRLTSLASPQRRLPDWRIVRPPSPDRLVRAYRRAERRSGVGWEYLAAIHLVETRMGRIRGVSTAGAQGPMQFLPTTWEIYGEGGDIEDPEDAVMAAARLLRANGAPGDMARALWHYNQSHDYVFAVTSYAANMRRTPRAYQGYWHWRVLYRHESGTKVLPVGYPRRPAVPLGRS